MMKTQETVQCETVEGLLEATFRALVKMDNLALAGLLHTCESMDSVSVSAPALIPALSPTAQSSFGFRSTPQQLSVKLRLLHRMLMQTEAGLHVLGISTRAYASRTCTPVQTSLQEQ
jgi:hypothetical protein